MVINVPFIYSTGLAIVTEVDLRCGDLLSKKKLSQIGSFLWLLVLATECSFSFDIFEMNCTATLF